MGRYIVDDAEDDSESEEEGNGIGIGIISAEDTSSIDRTTRTNRNSASTIVRRIRQVPRRRN